MSSFEIQRLQCHATSVERSTEKADNFLNLNINSEIVDILFAALDRLGQAGASALRRTSESYPANDLYIRNFQSLIQICGYREMS
jgi:hypothetical protein